MDAFYLILIFSITHFILKTLNNIIPNFSDIFVIILKYIFYFGQKGFCLNYINNKKIFFNIFPIVIYFDLTKLFLKSIILWLTYLGSNDITFTLSFTINNEKNEKIDYEFQKTISKINRI